jgi:CHAT domain-containing protein
MQEAGELTSYRYLVFSCHGVAPPETDPVLQPALILSHPDPATGGEGFLTMGDVFGLTLNADLVVLSACNTGKGRVLQGEGVAGLTRAFMFAGSPAVAVTLWSVESSSAKALSTGLFAALAQGKPRAAALRQAKLQLLQDQDNPLFQHPFFWAPLIIFGDG